MGLWCIDCNNVQKAEFDEEKLICKKCGSNKMVNSPGDMTLGEMFILRDISKDTSFIQAMIDLREKDPIEYQLKMSQFKTNLAQQKVEKENCTNTPHCPTCNSTNIKKISSLSKAGSVAAFGLFSRKIHKQWHCNNCGSEW